MQRFEVGIIGAGIAGASLAGQLAPHRATVLLEQESQPGYHATGRSAAYFAPSYGSERVRAITVASEPFFRSPPDGFTATPLITPRAALFIAGIDAPTALEQFLAANPATERCAPAACCALVPVLRTDRIAGGALDGNGGDLDVDAILQGFLRVAKAHGAKLNANETVTALTYQDGLWQVDTDTTRYAVDVLVNAAGAWADRVAALAGLTPLKLSPLRRTAVLVDPPHGVDLTGWPLTIGMGEAYYFKPEAGQLLISPADETPSPPADAQPEELAIALAIDRVQQVADLPVTRVNHSWAGLRTFAPDRELVSGFDPRAPQFYWLAGQGGYGVQTCPAMAEIATLKICGRTSWLDPALAERLGEGLGPERLLS